MADVPFFGRTGYRLLYLALAGTVIFMLLLPLDTVPGAMPGPDVLLLVTFAWVLRQPDYAPVLLIAAVFLMADILFMRPLGLWTAIVIVATETLRARLPLLRDKSFLFEWLLVGGVLLAMHLANAAILSVFFVDRPPLGSTLIRLIASLIAYPIIVALAARAFGIRRRAPGEHEPMGLRA